MRNVIGYIFILSAFLIAAAYFLGLVTDAQAATTGGVNLIRAVTGRKADNSFANYPVMPAA